MFIFSIKLSKLLKKVAVGTALFVFCVFVITTGFKLFSKENKVEPIPNKNISVNTNVNGESENTKIKFLNEKGIKVKGEARGVVEVLVPKEFDDNYVKYNDLQKENGFDLSKLKGKELKQWTYDIDTGNKKEEFTINLLMDKDTVVGCDIVDKKNNLKLSIQSFLNR